MTIQTKSGPVGHYHWEAFDTACRNDECPDFEKPVTVEADQTDDEVEWTCPTCGSTHWSTCREVPR